MNLLTQMQSIYGIFDVQDWTISLKHIDLNKLEGEKTMLLNLHFNSASDFLFLLIRYLLISSFR